MWVTLHGFSSSLYLEPGHLNTACCTQGSGAVHCFPEPRTLHIDEGNKNTVHVLQCGFVYSDENVNESPTYKLASVTAFICMHRRSSCLNSYSDYAHEPVCTPKQSLAVKPMDTMFPEKQNGNNYLFIINGWRE